jgi:hypothetical protein
VKYLSTAQILESVEKLKPHNGFFGITFLVAKKNKLPVGKSISFHLDAANQRFLDDYYRPNSASQYYFRPYRENFLAKEWTNPDYAGKGLQRVNTAGFGRAFLHESNTSLWGWHTDYVQSLKKRLRNRRLPLFHMAVWILRKDGWSKSITRSDILKKFIADFHLTKLEIEALSSTEIDSRLPEAEAFQATPSTWDDVQSSFQPPPDFRPTGAGALSFLEINGIGPTKSCAIEFGDRLNILTGDNGLGKTFVLDAAWYALTGQWAGDPLIPADSDSKVEPSIKFSISSDSHHKKTPVTATFDFHAGTWHEEGKRREIPGLVVYARVDGSFAVWDPAAPVTTGQSPALKFSREGVWDGIPGRIEGLIRDWGRWQSKDETSPFDVFVAVLERLSPPDLGKLTPGDPVRLTGDPREIPTLVHPYDTVPITQTSAGVRRIVTLAYLIVWAWSEHELHCRRKARTTDSKMVILVDEVEAHLHPKWQRVILPALLDISKSLSDHLAIQLLLTTHSPLVLASGESVFEDADDKLFSLDLNASRAVTLQERQFVKYGRIDSWLRSPIFQLDQARSTDAEAIIRQAVELQTASKSSKAEVEVLTKKLIDVLPVEDPFWPRWILFARSHEVKI